LAADPATASIARMKAKHSAVCQNRFVKFIPAPLQIRARFGVQIIAARPRKPAAAISTGGANGG
jgi:hypothetical protein